MYLTDCYGFPILFVLLCYVEVRVSFFVAESLVRVTSTKVKTPSIIYNIILFCFSHYILVEINISFIVDLSHYFLT